MHDTALNTSVLSTLHFKKNFDIVYNILFELYKSNTFYNVERLRFSFSKTI